jgi:hypothetical protein
MTKMEEHSSPKPSEHKLFKIPAQPQTNSSNNIQQRVPPLSYTRQPIDSTIPVVDKITDDLYKIIIPHVTDMVVFTIQVLPKPTTIMSMAIFQKSRAHPGSHLLETRHPIYGPTGKTCATMITSRYYHPQVTDLSHPTLYTNTKVFYEKNAFSQTYQKIPLSELTATHAVDVPLLEDKVLSNLPSKNRYTREAALTATQDIDLQYSPMFKPKPAITSTLSQTPSRFLNPNQDSKRKCTKNNTTIS